MRRKPWEHYPALRPRNDVGTYCRRFKACGADDPDSFARAMLARDPDLCLRVVEEIGSWPSSEPELAALQRAFR